MKRVILNTRETHPDYSWSNWRVVWLVAEHESTWRIWSVWEPFTRLVHKNAVGERVRQL